MKFKYCIVLIVSMIIIGCSTSRTKFVKLNTTDYEIIQYGKADVELTEKGIIKIKNPQGTISGTIEFLKSLFLNIGGKTYPTADITGKK